MRNLLAALVGIAQRTARFSVAEVTAIYNRLWQLIALATAACAATMMLNGWFGFKAPSLILAIIFVIAAVYIWAKPLNILTVVGGGAFLAKLVGHERLAAEVEDVFAGYLKFLKWFLVVSLTFLLIAGTISFKANRTAILPMLVALLLIGAFIWKWPDVFAGNFGKKLVYAYAVVIVVLSFASLVPGAMWVKYAHWDPEMLKTTSSDEALYRLTRIKQEKMDEDRAKELNRIADKIERREALTEAEERTVEAQRSQSSKKSSAGIQKVSYVRELPVLAMPPNGDSAHINAPPGRSVIFHGRGYTAHCMYTNLHVGTVGDPTNPCSSGPMLYQFVRDTTGEQNAVTYEFH